MPGNNLIERRIKPWRLGAKNWLFVGSELAGQRAAVVMSLVQSAKLNGLDPWAYLRDVLARIYSHPSNRLEEWLPASLAGKRIRRQDMKDIEALIDDGGEIALGHLGGIGCAATAADGHNALAKIVRRDGEALNSPIRRLDKAIGQYYDCGTTTDEINPPSD